MRIDRAITWKNVRVFSMVDLVRIFQMAKFSGMLLILFLDLAQREVVWRAEYSLNRKDIPGLVAPGTSKNGSEAGFPVWSSKKK